jgi:SAM-dependent methyltransferase
MLKDTIRTDAYRDFIYNNKNLFKDKVILDIGCGTGKMMLDQYSSVSTHANLRIGILSMFCAKAGASRVLAVDNSDIINKARENVFLNGLSDTITCIRGRVEEVSLPTDKVDIIVSEWMGYALLYEAMLPSIIWARDRYLKPEGLLVPSVATLWIAPVSDADYIADNISFWKDVYGFNMSAMQSGLFDEGRILSLPEDRICGEPCPFVQLSLHTIRAEDLIFKSNWQLKLLRDVEALHGYLIWFDIFFTQARNDESIRPNTSANEWTSNASMGRVAFTTGPSGKETHWKQCLLLNPPEIALQHLKADCELVGMVGYSAPEENIRALSIEISWTGSVDGVNEVSRVWNLS